MKRNFLSAIAIGAVIFVVSCAQPKQTTCEITKTTTPMTDKTVRTWNGGSKEWNYLKDTNSVVETMVEKSFQYYGAMSEDQKKALESSLTYEFMDNDVTTQECKACSNSANANTKQDYTDVKTEENKISQVATCTQK